MFKMMLLPYPNDALEPHMSAKTLDFHYGKHYKTYLDNLNTLIDGTDFQNLDLVEIIKKTNNKPEYALLFNNAAQVYNHEFFFSHIGSDGGVEPKGELAKKIVRDFGSWEMFKAEFKKMAISQFGSGWAWLIEFEGKLEVIKTPNAETPIARGIEPLAVVDVWEHSYYLDYQNRRADYLDIYLNHLIKL